MDSPADNWTTRFGVSFKRKFCSIYSFAVIFALFGIYSSAFYACFTANMSTIERRYSFSSSTGAYVLITDNVATVLTSLFVGHYGKTVHKPRWMAIACLITGLSIALMALPYFLFGSPSEHEIEEILKSSAATNATSPLATSAKSKAFQMCMDVALEEKCDIKSINKASIVTSMALFVFGASNFMRGFGATLFFTYGAPYIDDNVSKAKMPLLFACIFASRVVGFPIGNFVSSFALTLYENPLLKPVGLTKNDPSWIGAWWLGFVVFGLMLMTLAIPLSFFPAEFERKKKKKQLEDTSNGVNHIEDEFEEIDLENRHATATTATATTATTNNNGNYNNKKLPLASLNGKAVEVSGINELQENELAKSTSLRDLPGELWEIVKNPIIFCQMLGDTFRGFGILGFFVFQTRYLENEFRQSASTASFISGTTGFLAKMFGVVFGGLFITCLRPGPKFLTSYIFLVEVTSVFALLTASIFFGPQHIFTNNQIDPATNQLQLLSQCNLNCHCENVKYQPVCGKPNGNGNLQQQQPMMSFFSPCHAGCKKSFSDNLDQADSSRYFSDCSCIPQSSGISSLRKCPSDDNVYTYAYIISIGSMISGSSRAGNAVTFLRSITAEQKALAVALKSFWHSLVVSIPYPIVYGKIFDWNCIVWRKECNKKGNCWLYDTESLRLTYHGISITLIALGSVFDLIMIFLSPRLGQLYDDEDISKKSFFQKLKSLASSSKKKTNDQDADGTSTNNNKHVEEYKLGKVNLQSNTDSERKV